MMKSFFGNILLISALLFMAYLPFANADYDRNKAVAVEQVLFGKISSVRNISQEQLLADKKNGWKTFGSALIGGVIGHQFGGGSGQDIATVLGAIIGGSVAHNRQQQQQTIIIQLVELMITIDSGKQFMVIQDYDSTMPFNADDAIRLIYLEGGTVRVDKQR